MLKGKNVELTGIITQVKPTSTRHATEEERLVLRRRDLRTDTQLLIRTTPVTRLRQALRAPKPHLCIRKERVKHPWRRTDFPPFMPHRWGGKALRVRAEEIVVDDRWLYDGDWCRGGTGGEVGAEVLSGGEGEDEGEDEAEHGGE